MSTEDEQMAGLMADSDDLPQAIVSCMRAELEADTGLDLSTMSARGVVLNHRAMDRRHALEGRTA